MLRKCKTTKTSGFRKKCKGHHTDFHVDAHIPGGEQQQQAALLPHTTKIAMTSGSTDGILEGRSAREANHSDVAVPTLPTALMSVFFAVTAHQHSKNI